MARQRSLERKVGRQAQKVRSKPTPLHCVSAISHILYLEICILIRVSGWLDLLPPHPLLLQVLQHGQDVAGGEEAVPGHRQPARGHRGPRLGARWADRQLSGRVSFQRRRWWGY